MKKISFGFIAALTLISCSEVKEENLMEKLDQYIIDNDIPSIFDDTEEETDSINQLIESNAKLKYPVDDFMRKSEIEDQRNSYDYMQIMDDDDSLKLEVQKAYPEDFVKQNKFYNEMFEDKYLK